MSDAFRTTFRSVRFKDGYQNFEAAVGVGTDNQLSSSSYGMNPITRNRGELDNMYRGSWVVRQAVDVIPEDMTRAGVELVGQSDPEDFAKVQAHMTSVGAHQGVTAGLKWGRLYGGAISVPLVRGQKLSQPLDLEAVRRGDFCGVMTLDRWQLRPGSELVSEFGPHFGKPKYYHVGVVDDGSPTVEPVHYSRALRFEGCDLPHFQRRYEMGWGMSVVEPFYDRLVAFDSTTMGMAQMVFKAHLRTLKIKNFKKSIATGGDAYQGQVAMVNMMRRYQTLEGLSLIDSEDELEYATYNFGGLTDVLVQMSQQVAGSLQMPMVKFFGLSPAGFSSGESDVRLYYDGIGNRQERDLRHPYGVVTQLAFRSALGRAPDRDFSFKFNPLYGMTSQEKAQVASTTASAVTSAVGSGVLKPSQGLRELKAQSNVTGVFASITDEDVERAEAEERQGQDTAPGGGSQGDEENGQMTLPGMSGQDDTVESPEDSPYRPDSVREILRRGYPRLAAVSS